MKGHQRVNQRLNHEMRVKKGICSSHIPEGVIKLRTEVRLNLQEVITSLEKNQKRVMQEEILFLRYIFQEKTIVNIEERLCKKKRDLHSS